MKIRKLVFSVLLLLVVLVALITFSCTGWSEGSTMSGTCSIPGLAPIYNFSMGILLMLAFTAIVWVPALIIILKIFGYFMNKKDKTN